MIYSVRILAYIAWRQLHIPYKRRLYLVGEGIYPTFSRLLEYKKHLKMSQIYLRHLKCFPVELPLPKGMKVSKFAIEIPCTMQIAYTCIYLILLI